jgi:uncharacterized protein
MKYREAYWAAVGTVGLEHLILLETQDGVQANGLVLRHHNGQGLRLAYQIECDPGWKTRRVSVQLFSKEAIELHLFADGDGKWKGRDGEALTELDGCQDVDVMATPFTNTLPIRRLGLAVGESREIAVAYISIPDLSFSRARQRYSCLEQRPGGWLYLYESLEGDFKAELAVDEQGLVLDYQGIWVRSL